MNLPWTDLTRYCLERVVEIRFWLNDRSAPLEFVLNDGKIFSVDLDKRHQGSAAHEEAAKAMVRLHTLWSGQQFEFEADRPRCLYWRRIPNCGGGVR